MTSISIKSEIDSRVVLYPLLRCLKPLGNCLVITSNKQVARLIDGDFEGDFRNFHIIVDIDGGTDEALEQAGINPESYTFVVYDNVGVVEQDKLIIPIGPIISEAFESEMLYLGEDRNTHILRFGKAVANKSTAKKPVKSEDGSTLSRSSKPVMSEEDIDKAAKAKFQPKKEDVMDKLKKLPNMMFPKFEDLEFLESNKQFFAVDGNFVKFFFTVFQEYIGIKEPNFIKEVNRQDARSSSIDQRPASGENSIELNAR